MTCFDTFLTCFDTFLTVFDIFDIFLTDRPTDIQNLDVEAPARSLKIVLGSTHLVELLSFSMILSVLSFVSH